MKIEAKTREYFIDDKSALICEICGFSLEILSTDCADLHRWGTNMPRLKKCPECGGKMERSKTKFITDTKNGLIAIENIDSDNCSICGAQYLTAEADEYIENIIDMH